MKRLHEQGFRGVRFNYMKHLGTAVPIDDVMRLATRLAGIGWHLQLHMESNLIAQMTPALHRSQVPVLIEHMERLDASTHNVFISSTEKTSGSRCDHHRRRLGRPGLG